MGQRARKSLTRIEQDRIRVVLTEAREAAGMSQRELSKRLNQSAPYIWAVEKGDRTIDLVEFIDIAAVLGVNPVELFARVFRET